MGTAVSMERAIRTMGTLLAGNMLMMMFALAMVQQGDQNERRPNQKNGFTGCG